MGCTSASRRGGPAWGSGGVTTLTVRAFGNRSGCRFHRVCMPDFTAFWIASRRAARPYRQRSSGGDYSSPLPIGCTFISNRGTTEGASPNSPSPRAGSRRPHVPCWRSRHCPADKRAALASRPFVLSGVTSGCCRRCSDLGRHQCRSLSRWDPVPLSSSRMCRSMSSRKNRVQDRRLRPRLHSRTRDPRKRSVKEPVCVPCSPPFGMTRADCYWEALNRPGLGASVSWLQDGSPERLIARDCGEIGAGGPPVPREPVLFIQASLLGIADRPGVGLRSPQER